MTRVRFTSCCLLLLSLSGSGCELVADFDRSRIPQAASDSGTDGDRDSGSGGGPDGSLVPPDSGSPLPDGGPPVPDAGPPSVGDGAAPAPVDAG